MKKQTRVALILLLLIPVVLRLGGFLFSRINPEIAAGHPDYVRNFHRLSLLKNTTLFASFAVVAILWFVICVFVIRSKQRSLWWLVLALLGPIGFAILAALNDKAPLAADRYVRFVHKLNPFVRVGYEVCIFIVIWLLAYQGMVVKRVLMILYQSATTGMSTAQIIDIQNASSGMWAFAEGNEVMYLVVLFYLLQPVVFNFVGRLATRTASPNAR